jgi:hypothetical protein
MHRVRGCHLLMSEHGRARRAGWVRALAAGLCALALAGTGCSGDKEAANPPAAANAPASDRYKVTAETADFYLYGPQQPNGPTLTLKKDTRLTMVKRAYGYSRVNTPDGQTGYIGTEEIAPLSPEELADEAAAMQQVPSAETLKRMGPMEGGYTIPPEAGNDERLPVPDASPSPKPTLTQPFHY